MNEITIDKNAKQITFTNNGICFSQFGVANEILDLIENQTKEIERLNNIINELENWLAKEYISGNYEELYRIGLQDSYDKLQELKGSDKE